MLFLGLGKVIEIGPKHNGGSETAGIRAFFGLHKSKSVVAYRFQ